MTNGRNRREGLLQSLKPKIKGGLMRDGINPTLEKFGYESTQFKVTGHCRTFLFEFPGSHLVAEEPVRHQVIYECSDLKAAVVSDLPAYFEKSPANSLHFKIDVSLRAAVQSTYEEALRQPTIGKLFLVIEQISEITPTELSDGQCFTVDEVRDGKVVIPGGREGERALVAVRTVDCPWPDYRCDMGRVNIVLAAVKAMQDVTGSIRQLYEFSCFVSSEEKAVYIRNCTTTTRATGSTTSPLTPDALEDRASRIRAMLGNMMKDSELSAKELFDSVVLDETMDDDYLRLWYLRLWQALGDAGKHLGQPQLWNKGPMIAGNRTPKELRCYRKDIAHWYTGRIDHAYLSDLQYTAMELLRRKYGGNTQPGGNLK